MKTLFKILLFIALIFGVLYIALNEKDISLEKAKETLANDDSKFVEINGLNVHYRREGNGFPIVLVHGTSAILQAWDAWTPILVENGYEVIRMDIPAFGLTGANAENDYSIPAYVDFIESFTNALNLDSFHLAGSSLGGQIAWEYAVDHQDKLGKLILISPAGMHDENSKSIFSIIANNKGIAKKIKNIGTKMLVKSGLKQSYFDDDKITAEQLKNYRTATLIKGNRAALMERMSTIDEPRISSLESIETPTLLLWGTEDKLVAYQFAATYEKEIPNAQLITYENMGHIPMEEIPEQSVADALKFLKE